MGEVFMAVSGRAGVARVCALKIVRDFHPDAVVHYGQIPSAPYSMQGRSQAVFTQLNNIENNLDGFKTTDWLNAHANYTNWYRYFAIARGIRHYDTWPSANKNGAWYFEPLYGASNSFQCTTSPHGYVTLSEP